MTSCEFKEWRRRIGYNQAQAGKLLGVNRQTVYLWESGKTPIPPRVDQHCLILWMRLPGWSKLKDLIFEEAKRIEVK